MSTNRIGGLEKVLDDETDKPINSYNHAGVNEHGFTDDGECR